MGELLQREQSSTAATERTPTEHRATAPDAPGVVPEGSSRSGALVEQHDYVQRLTTNTRAMYESDRSLVLVDTVDAIARYRDAVIGVVGDCRAFENGEREQLCEWLSQIGGTSSLSFLFSLVSLARKATLVGASADLAVPLAKALFNGAKLARAAATTGAVRKSGTVAGRMLGELTSNAELQGVSEALDVGVPAIRHLAVLEGRLLELVGAPDSRLAALESDDAMGLSRRLAEGVAGGHDFSTEHLGDHAIHADRRLEEATTLHSRTSTLLNDYKRALAEFRSDTDALLTHASARLTLVKDECGFQ